MAQTTFRGEVVRTAGELPAVGEPLPPLTLTDTRLQPFTAEDLRGSVAVLSVFPSIDTRTCQASVREFSARAVDRPGVVVVNVSADLPFAQARFCAAEGIENVRMGSTFRDPAVLDVLGVRMLGGAFEGLAARAVVVVDADGTVVHTEMVPDVGHEPDYDAALAAVDRAVGQAAA
jgi:thioredoxin-dependent peroxiredoxin